MRTAGWPQDGLEPSDEELLDDGEVTMATTIESIPPLERREAEVLAAEEYGRFEALLTSLGPSDWEAPTECPPWTVRDMATHVLAACEAIGSFREMIHQVRAARRIDGIQIDAINQVQIDERRALTREDILQAFPIAASRSIRGRKRLPAFVRRHRQTAEFAPDHSEPWTLAYLYDVIYTRDTWMHRIDIARATGRPIELSAAHDGRIVADLVADWARRHGGPVALTLTGPAGGRFDMGTGGPDIKVDAVTFGRNISGRDAPPDGLLSIRTPF